MLVGAAHAQSSLTINGTTYTYCAAENQYCSYSGSARGLWRDVADAAIHDQWAVHERRAMLDRLRVADRPGIRLREELLVREHFANANADSDSDSDSNTHPDARARPFAIGFMDAMRC
jgi:hypothetical protein